MTAERLLVLGLDGYEARVGDALIAQGRMPHLAALKERSARFTLDHGFQKYTGLAWDHVATGLAPERSGVWSAVNFDPQTYNASHGSTRAVPVFAGLNARTVVFDAPYFDLSKAQKVSGLVNWGAHDPGVRPMARPENLKQEIVSRFGPYPATEFIYAFTWPDPTRTDEAGQRLTEALEQRADISCWLLQERLPDWDIAVLVVSELHSIIEPMWHGWDENHPLHDVESAPGSRAAIESVYEALDRMVGALTDAFPDATIAAFSMHGMGGNEADVPSMALLPELMYRQAFGTPLLEVPAAWSGAANGLPMLKPGQNWDSAVKAHLGDLHRQQSGMSRLMKRVTHKVGTVLEQLPGNRAPVDQEDVALDWMPATSYRRFWSKMAAFAIPSFYDGRVRINLEGRESGGLVPLSRYGEVCAEIEQIIRDCTDSRTNEPVVNSVHMICPDDPMTLDSSQADMIILWNGSPVGLVHPHLGQIGPVPLRRTGGHTGGDGILYLAGGPIAAGDHGRRSAFDVVPTLINVMGEVPPWPISGKSILTELPTG